MRRCTRALAFLGTSALFLALLGAPVSSSSAREVRSAWWWDSQFAGTLVSDLVVQANEIAVALDQRQYEKTAGVWFDISDMTTAPGTATLRLEETRSTLLTDHPPLQACLLKISWAESGGTTFPGNLSSLDCATWNGTSTRGADGVWRLDVSGAISAWLGGVTNHGIVLLPTPGGVAGTYDVTFARPTSASLVIGQPDPEGSALPELPTVPELPTLDDIEVPEDPTPGLLDHLPERPDDPETPDLPEDPDLPGEDDLPDGPDDPDLPGEDDLPGGPEDPDLSPVEEEVAVLVATVRGYVDELEPPDPWDLIGLPETIGEQLADMLPDGPEEPELPDDDPEVPEAPGIPEVPDAPDAPDGPDVPGAPDGPDAPQVPDALDAPDAPDGPDAPDVPDAPQAPDAPEVPGPPEVPDAPDGPSEPSGDGGPSSETASSGSGDTTVLGAGSSELGPEAQRWADFEQVSGTTERARDGGEADGQPVTPQLDGLTLAAPGGDDGDSPGIPTSVVVPALAALLVALSGGGFAMVRRLRRS